MSLTDKIKACAGAAIIGLSSLAFSGCGTMITKNEGSDPGLGMAILGGIVGARSDQLRQQGEYNRAAAGDALTGILGGAANYQRQSQIAKDGRSEINVNTGTQSKPRQVYIQAYSTQKSNQMPKVLAGTISDDRSADIIREFPGAQIYAEDDINQYYLLREGNKEVVAVPKRLGNKTKYAGYERSQ